MIVTDINSVKEAAMPKNFICAPDYPVVETPKGKIRGYLYEGVFNFKGIKYANAKRFHQPEPVEAWEGIKDALSWGFNCPTMKEDPCTVRAFREFLRALPSA